jgi:CRP-like cAMP-binding protein/small-conductance mechanosensitive channel
MTPDLAGTLTGAALTALLLGRVLGERQVRLQVIWWWLALAVAAGLAGRVGPLLGMPAATGVTATSLAWMFAWLGLVHTGAILVFHVLLGRLRLPRLASDLTIGAAYAAVVAISLRRMGADPASLLTTSAVLTAVLGFALQDMLVNLVGGLVLEFEKVFAPGDWIRTEHGTALVRDIRLRHTLLENPDGDLVVLPNSILTRAPVVVLGRAGVGEQIRHRILIRFHVDYEHSPPALIGAVEQALRQSPVEGVAEDPPPRCVLFEYEPNHAQYGVLVWIQRPGLEYIDASSVRLRVYYACSRVGVPLSAIHYRLDNYSPAPRVSSQRLAALETVEILSVLTPEERHELAETITEVSFAPGETILKEGDAGDSLFMVKHGRVRVLLARANGLSEQIAVLGPGQIFGEMSLLTGEPRSATVVAAEQTDCLVLGKADLLRLLERRPALAAEISAVVAARQQGLAEARQRITDQSSQFARMRFEDLLGRVQRYFGLDKSSGKTS